MWLVGCALWPRLVGGGEREAREAPLYAATIDYVADRFRCSAKKPCCYSVDGRVPSVELVKLFRNDRRLKAIVEHGACIEWTIDVGRVPPYDGVEQHVASAVGAEGAPIVFCTHILKLNADGWVVDPKQDDCPVT
jgi:hypothetical protein